MRNIPYWLLCGILFLNGCSSDLISSFNPSYQYDLIETDPAYTIQKLEEGLSVVRFDGDDGVEDFLNAGGASNEEEIFTKLSFGCSTISVSDAEGNQYFGRNFDWYPCDALILEDHPENGYASISTVNTSFITQSMQMRDDLLIKASIFAPLDGMNEKGFCVSVNMIEDSDTIDQISDLPDLTATTAIRMLLNQAGNVEEAVSLLRQYDMHASFGYMVHFALSDAEGNSVVVEYIDQKMHVTDTDVVTNFYLTDSDKYGKGTAQSHTRYERLMEAIDHNASFDTDAVLDALESVSKHNFNDGETTEWSIVFDQTNLEALYCHEEDYTKAYHFILRS